MGPEVKLSTTQPPETFVIEVLSELGRDTLQKRWQSVNVILRLTMLAGVQMQLDATLNLLCDFAAEITPHDAALVHFWEDSQEQVQLRVARGLESVTAESLQHGDLFNFWAAKFNRPLLIRRGCNLQADLLLNQFGAASALVVPLFVNNRVMGSMQLLSSKENTFDADDAQLLWVLALVSESMLTRDYTNDGLIRFAFTDYLTGLKTRGYFEQQLELEIKRGLRNRSKFALLMIDIDYFKALNDHYGHHVGDQVLRDVASILMRDMREVDTAARYGGEEFVIILPDTNAAAARQVADRLRRGVEQAKFFAGSPDAVERLSVSIGVSIFAEDGNTRSELIEAADGALYAAKSRGRNKVLLYQDLVRDQKREVG